MSQTSGTRYRDLRAERDEAVRRAVEAERFSHKEEVERAERRLEEAAKREGRLAAKLYLAREFATDAVEAYVTTRSTIAAAMTTLDNTLTHKLEKATGRI